MVAKEKTGRKRMRKTEDSEQTSTKVAKLVVIHFTVTLFVPLYAGINSYFF